jgi:hypothetical protein
MMRSFVVIFFTFTPIIKAMERRSIRQEVHVLCEEKLKNESKILVGSMKGSYCHVFSDY